MIKLKCSVCPRKCNIDRDIAKGYCGLDSRIKISRAAPHFWEEPCISGSKGSGAVFFTGCSLKCVFCQNYEISVNHVGTFITPQQLANCYRNLEDQGVHNINLVSASHFIEAVLESFKIYRPKIPVLYNSSGYETVESLKRLEGYIDIYLPDFKYSDNRLALKYSSAYNYSNVALAAIKEMVRQTGKVQFDKNGIIQKGTIVRVLVLPNHTKDSIAILNTIKAYYGDNVLVSVMGQYTPMGEAYKYPELNRKITEDEYEEVVNHAIELDMDGFVQELSSASEEFVPNFDCSSSDYFNYNSTH